jgi:hypothetical protein
MKTTKRKFLLVILALLLLLPNISPAAAITLNLDYPEIGGFDLNTQQDLNQVVAWFYYFVITIAGMAVFAMLVWGGFTWLTSTGDPSKIGNAKDRIYSAFLGLILILASFLIMQTINPELVVLKLPELSTGPCTVGCDFEPMGPCPPAKPNLVPVAGGVCCCP